MINENKQRCLLFVVDALSHRIVNQHCQSGNLTNLSKLIHRGGELRQCLSIFPSITPAATCSITTGCYPKQHHIEGASWFDRERGEIAYFGDDVQFALERGLRDFFVDFADHLNFEMLNCPTIFERLHSSGIDSACINFMWFAGPHWHERRTPLVTRLLAGKLAEKVRGPRYLKLGDFVETLPEGIGPLAKDTIFNRYGFRDGCTENVLKKLAQSNALPPFTLAYFPINDDTSHEEGPNRSAEKVLKPFDQFLGEFIEAAGGWDRVGEDLTILIVGDHSQTEFPESGPNAIQIDRCLSQFKQALPGNGWKGDDEIFLCPNMRATAIYLRDANDESLQRKVISRVLAEPQVDQVIYEDSEGNCVVTTANRGTLTFAKADSSTKKSVIVDDYENQWQYEGDLSAVDCQIGSDGRLVEGRYPNPLERIDGAFVQGSRPIWLTAIKDAEFQLSETSIHSGGSHGALNFEDSESALITSPGVSLDRLPNPGRPRIIDIATLCQNTLAKIGEELKSIP